MERNLAIESISTRRSGCRIGKAANLRRKATIASIGTATPAPTMRSAGQWMPCLVIRRPFRCAAKQYRRLSVNHHR